MLARTVIGTPIFGQPGQTRPLWGWLADWLFGGTIIIVIYLTILTLHL